MLTYGLEIELIDVLRKSNLPHNCRWASQEITLVNSNGQAVWSHDPAKPLGGEVNTPPTLTLTEQLRIIQAIFDYLPESKVNYRCNTQVHVGFTEKPDLSTIKKMIWYFYTNFDDLKAASLSGAITKPLGMPSYTWHHYRHSNIPPHQIDYMMSAESEQQLRQAFFLSKQGKPAFMTFRRHMINFHCLFNHGTVEFRGFWATKDIALICNCLMYADKFIEESMSDNPLPAKEWAYSLSYPKEIPFDPILEAGFQATKASKDSLPKENKRYELYTVL